MNPTEKEISEALGIIIVCNKASASFLQRKMGIGYVKAIKILEALEEKGYVGPSKGPMPREILIK